MQPLRVVNRSDQRLNSGLDLRDFRSSLNSEEQQNIRMLR